MTATAADDHSPPPPPAPHPHAPSTWGDRIFKEVCRGSSAFVILLALTVVVVLVGKSWLAMKTLGFGFLIDTEWDPEESHRKFGALSLVYGTVITSAIAMLIAIPLGVGTASFLSEIAPPWLRKSGSFFVEMLAAVPSVVYGFWGIFVLGPFLQSIVTSLGGPNNNGAGIVPAGFILAIMIVPYVSAVTFDVLQAVPNSQRQGALALGATRWQVTRTVVVPYAFTGIVGGSFLALGRALGETMAVTMLIGNRQVIDLSLYPMGDSIASIIANQCREAAYDLHVSVLIELGLILLVVSAVLSGSARLLIARMQSGKRLPIRKWLGLEKPRVPLAFSHLIEMPNAGGSTPSRSRLAQRVDRLMTGVLFLCLVVTVGFLFLIFGYLVVEGIGGLNWNFFTALPKPVGEKGGGMANAFYGSFLLVGIATLFAVPLGLLTAIYLAEYRRGRLASTVRFVAELLGSVPSVVIGIFAFSVAVQPFHHFSGLAGSFALAVIMLPVVIRASEEALKLVPETLRYASYALGANRWQTIVRISVPAALPAIITAAFLSVARVAGETAPLLFTAFSNRYWVDSPTEPTPSLPFYIYQYSQSADAEWLRQAWSAALMLLVVVMLLNFGIRAATGQRVVSASRSE